MDLYEWKTKNANARKYAHFDEKVSLDKVWDYISDPTNIVKHGFYPFIHYEKKFNKFTRKDGRGYIKEKSRHLCYSAHIDSYIYSYCAYNTYALLYIYFYAFYDTYATNTIYT